jgi:hypothetical protein
MKTIVQAAAEYAENESSTTRSEQVAFVDGAVFAQRWIPVEDELPEVNKQVLVKIQCVLKQLTDRRLDDLFELHSMGHYDGIYKKWFILHSLVEKNYHCTSWKVTHWRPIELHL